MVGIDCVILNLFTQSYCVDHITEEILGGDGGDGENSNHGSEGKSEQPLREQDRFLPIANIAKIMKRAIPETGKVTNIEKNIEVS